MASTPTGTIRTEFLTDSQNHTGYSQVLQETEFNSSGQAIKRTIYTVGHDQISQTVREYVNGNWTNAVTHNFGTDGHGSVRVLYNAISAVAAIVNHYNVPQVFTFDAYGNLLNFAGFALTPQASPLTTYLYNSERFDFRTGRLYLRARDYDPTTGRFPTLDPFFGNSSDPQSFHKYLFVHGDPVNGIDPSGMFLGIAITTLLSTNLRNADASRGAAGLHAAHSLQKVVAIYQKAMNFLAKAEEIYSRVEEIMDLLSLDVSDLVELRNSIASGSGGFLANAAPNRLVPLEIPIPDKILNSFKAVRSIAKPILDSNALQEFLGEMATAVVAYTLGFEQPHLNWHKKHGPDQVGVHSTGIWGIFEAKGGTSKLSHAVTSKGKQMSGEWISKWLQDIIRRNDETPAGKALELAFYSATPSPMLAAVTRLSMEDLPGERVGVEFHIGLQKYDPPSGRGMVPWLGF